MWGAFHTHGAACLNNQRTPFAAWKVKLESVATGRRTYALARHFARLSIVISIRAGALIVSLTSCRQWWLKLREPIFRWESAPLRHSHRDKLRLHEYTRSPLLRPARIHRKAGQVRS